MKSCLFTKSGIGALNGVLIERDKVQCDEEGHVKEYSLTGNVRDCEFNHVVVIGKKEDDTTINVDFMESYPIEDVWDSYIQHYFKGEDEYGVNVFIVPKSRIKEYLHRFTATGVPFTEIIFSMKAEDKGKDVKNMHLKINNCDFEKEISSPAYFFMIGKQPETRVENYGGKDTIASYAWAFQIRS